MNQIFEILDIFFFLIIFIQSKRTYSQITKKKSKMEVETDINQTTEEVLEGIGKGVLENWENGNIPSFLDVSTEDPTRQLLSFLSTPRNELKPGWESEFMKVLDKLSQIEYAIYGKQIAYFLLANSQPSENKKKRTNNRRQRRESKEEDHYQSLCKTFNVTPIYGDERNPYSQSKFKGSSSKRSFPEWLPTI